jgi:uncharacterized phage protein (TIGR01671 family)
MREIKFRGLTKDRKKWLIGDLNHINGEVYIFERDSVCLDSIDAFEVIPETIGQYTGLKDKNGKEIFEGDLVNFRANYTSKKAGYMNGEIVITSFSLEIHNEHGEYNAQEETDEFPYFNCQITGNIHEL